MWLLGDSQCSQNTRQEDRKVPYLIASMDDLTLNHAHNSKNSAHNSTIHTDWLTEVMHTHAHTENTHTLTATQRSESAFDFSCRVTRWTAERL